MGEHDDLEAVVRHVFGEVLVSVHHALAEFLAGAADGERTLAIRVPVGEEFGQMLFVPGQEELGEFVIVDGVGVGGVGEPDV